MSDHNNAHILYFSKDIVNRKGSDELTFELLKEQCNVDEHYIVSQFGSLDKLKQLAAKQSVRGGKTKTIPESRREHILSVAMDIAVNQGYDALTRERIAEQGSISTGLVSKVFNTMTQLHRAVMRCAIHREELSIIAHGIATGCRIAHGADEVLKRRAMDWLISNGGSEDDE